MQKIPIMYYMFLPALVMGGRQCQVEVDERQITMEINTGDFCYIVTSEFFRICLWYAVLEPLKIEQ